MLLLGEWKRKSCSSFERQSTQQQYLSYLNNLHSWRGAPFCLCAHTEAGDSDGSTCCRRHLSGDELKPIHKVSAQSLPENVQQNTSMSLWIETIQLSPNLVTFLHTNPSIYRNSHFNNVNKQKALLLHSKIKEAVCVIGLCALSPADIRFRNCFLLLLFSHWWWILSQGTPSLQQLCSQAMRAKCKWLIL